MDLVFSVLVPGALFVLLIWQAPAARLGAANGFALWAEVLVPSLLPFFAGALWLGRTGAIDRLGRRLSPLLGRWLGLSGSGCGVFLLGLSGGYPLGAASAAEAFRSGRITRREGERLLCTADNTGPAFAVGALGLGIFGDVRWGILLWLCHALSALAVGRLLREAPGKGDFLPSAPADPGTALVGAIRSGAEALIAIGGNVVFFSALVSVIRSALPCSFPEVGGWPLLRAVLIGALELSSGIAAMKGAVPSPLSLAVGAFLLSLGGLCVHFQSAALSAGAGLNGKGRLGGKLLQGVLAAALAALIGLFLCHTPPR